jgi:hypothetical protein
MNNERYNQIIDEAYENYCKTYKNQDIIEKYSFDTDPMIKEMFIGKIKFNQWFSEKWGLKIEERELSLEERRKLANYESEFVSPMTVESWDRNNIPTKLITITYKDEKIEVYE